MIRLQPRLWFTCIPTLYKLSAECSFNPVFRHDAQRPPNTQPPQRAHRTDCALFLADAWGFGAVLWRDRGRFALVADNPLCPVGRLRFFKKLSEAAPVADGSPGLWPDHRGLGKPRCNRPQIQGFVQLRHGDRACRQFCCGRINPCLADPGAGDGNRCNLCSEPPKLRQPVTSKTRHQNQLAAFKMS